MPAYFKIRSDLKIIAWSGIDTIVKRLNLAQMFDQVPFQASWHVLASLKTHPYTQVKPNPYEVARFNLSLKWSV